LSLRIKNEVSWNEKIGQEIKKSGIEFFTVPDIITTGEFEDNFYYISKYYKGKQISTVRPIDNSNLKFWIPNIIEINLFLLSLESNITFDRDKNKKSIIQNWDSYLEKIQGWITESKRDDLEEVFKVILEFKDTYEPGINHGDFVPWHMIHYKDKIVLVDAEHASSKSPKYYDVLYFFHRVYTATNAPDLAKFYLETLRNQLQEERPMFEKSIRPILASRIIGGFWDAVKIGQKDISFHLQLKKEFLENTI
jgi:hypothetical protein